MPPMATSWNAIRTISNVGASNISRAARTDCSTGPIRNGESSVPNPGRRPSAHAPRISDPTVTHTATVSGRPVRAWIAPMNTSSGPGPRSVQSVTATDAAIKQEPATKSTRRVEKVRTRRGGPFETTAATAPARDQARRRSRWPIVGCWSLLTQQVSAAPAPDPRAAPVSFGTGVGGHPDQPKHAKLPR